MCIRTTSHILRLTVSIFITAQDRIWSIHPFSNSNGMIALTQYTTCLSSKHAIVLSEITNIVLLIQLCALYVPDRLGVVEKLAVPLFVGTSFIDRYVKGILQTER